MIIAKEKKTNIAHWLEQYTESGQLDIVTGYFTVGAISWFSDKLNEQLQEVRLVIGDIASTADKKERPLDLLNQDIDVNKAFGLAAVAKKAVAFLEQEKVLIKTLEPNFCHAKLYLFQPENKDDRNYYFITGSSNLTEAGIGLKNTPNIELNVAELGKNTNYFLFKKWFDELWSRKQASFDKKVFKVSTEEGQYSINFKEYLIQEIKKIFAEYLPEDIYFKIIWELFEAKIDLEEQDEREKQPAWQGLQKSEVYQTLYTYQQQAVHSLLRMLHKHNGAILADAVGLGKTWTALAVMKYYQLKGYEVILLCPKKLENNWSRYRKGQESRFELDALDYYVRAHTDLQDERLAKDSYQRERKDVYFQNDRPKLLVIDESHNLRNHKSSRYKFLLEKLLQPQADVRLLMLSATPINNSFKDIRNQLQLMTKGAESQDSFRKLEVNGLTSIFREAQKTVNDWSKEEHGRLADLMARMPKKLVRLMDEILVARTRKMIEKQTDSLNFPEKSAYINYFISLEEVGNIEGAKELWQSLAPRLSAYMPAHYIKSKEKVSGFEDQKVRDFFLVKMMNILLIKRYESSWKAFLITAESIRDYHQGVLDQIKEFEKGNKANNYQGEFVNIELEEEEDTELKDGLDTIGKAEIALQDIVDAGNLERYKKDLKEDIAALEHIINNFKKLALTLAQEKQSVSTQRQSIDPKLNQLMRLIEQKQAAAKEGGNPKLIIFSAYKDTVLYLYEELRARGFNRITAITGQFSKDTEGFCEEKRGRKLSSFEPLLEAFAPYTKLYKEKVWPAYTPKENASLLAAFEDWKAWIRQMAEHKQDWNSSYQFVKEQLDHPIDILIATDALSEGQNLQDADMVVNYDIHWNPVRIIQRMGRVDRLGSLNAKIQGVNFWPSKDINEYLDLKGRVEQRLTTMTIAGAEVDANITERLKETLGEEKTLDENREKRQLQQIVANENFEEFDDAKGFGFDDFSMEKYRQSLQSHLEKETRRLLKMPAASYSGFLAKNAFTTEEGQQLEEGLLLLLQNKKEERKELLLLDIKGEAYSDNHRTILNWLENEKLSAERQSNIWSRKVKKEIDEGDPETIAKLLAALAKWQEKKASTKTVQEAVEKIGQSGELSTIFAKTNDSFEERRKLKNYQLLCWMYFNVE